ncbi:hypothetical protein IGI04_019250 [Brassica rapa subsp. trilocularis]|uniref:Reverse transcriptase zinc-binding domain-containing protein n=1 Tax=Brassica rapa subsp. trilocularis TaxID=1813537 RepID=A0ABQ7MHP6_BRACM|nr:hypothetical protein IGI04_019250 [Brassica rapa subsp. trilocularis]
MEKCVLCFILFLAIFIVAQVEEVEAVNKLACRFTDRWYKGKCGNNGNSICTREVKEFIAKHPDVSKSVLATFFWFDNWLEVGKLLDIAGEQGTRYLGILRTAKACDATENSQWRMVGGRTRVFQDLIAKIQERPLPVSDLGPYIVLWKHDQGDYKGFFSASRTWDQLRERREKVDWSIVVWFTQAVPRFSFITWLAIKNRLSTGDRMRVWGLQQECLLSGEKNETRDHLFFACPYSYTVWIRVTGRLFGTRITPDWQDTVAKIQYVRRP